MPAFGFRHERGQRFPERGGSMGPESGLQTGGSPDFSRRRRRFVDPIAHENDAVAIGNIDGRQLVGAVRLESQGQLNASQPFDGAVPPLNERAAMTGCRIAQLMSGAIE